MADMMPAREAKNAFGLMIDTARAEPVAHRKARRGALMVVSVEEYQRLSARPERVETETPRAQGAAKIGR